MQVYNDWIANLPVNNEAIAPLKEGETVFVTIKEKLNDNEAIVTIKWQDWHVRFQGDIPDMEKMAVQITGIHQGAIEVKAAAPKPFFQGMAGSELAKIEQLLSKQGIRLTK